MDRFPRICVLTVMVVSIMFSNTMAMGTGPISATFPLPYQYLDENKITLGFCDENTWKSKPNIHVGIDISVPAKEPVFSLCDGKVVHDETNEPETTYWNSFLIIEHNCDGHILFAYYGHVYSSVNNPNDIPKGEKIATIRHDTSGGIGDHLHLSISTGNDWDRSGWGYASTCEDAIAEGYKNPLTYLNFTAGTAPSPIKNLRIIVY